MADLNEMLVAWTGEIDSFMYTYILVILLVFVGIYYTIRTKAVQIRYIKDMFTQLTEKKHVQGEKSISSFQALMVSTASRVGTGNIAGIATAAVAAATVLLTTPAGIGLCGNPDMSCHQTALVLWVAAGIALVVGIVQAAKADPKGAELPKMKL